MADKTIEKMLIQIQYDVKKLQDSSKQVDNSIQNTVKKATSSFKGLFAFVEGGIGTTAIAAMVKGFADAGSHLYYMSQMLGMSVKQIGQLEEASKRFGGTKSGLDNTLTTIYTRTVNAAKGQDKDFVTAMAALGVTKLYNSDGSPRNPGDLLLEAAQGERLRDPKMHDSFFWTQRLGFDPNSIRFAQQNPSVLKKTMADAEQRGILDERQTEAARDAGNAINDLTQSLEYFKNVIVLQILPVLKYFTDPLLSITKDFKDAKSDLSRIYHEGFNKALSENIKNKTPLKAFHYEVDQFGNLANAVNQTIGLGKSFTYTPFDNQSSTAINLQKASKLSANSNLYDRIRYFQALQEGNNPNAVGDLDKRWHSYGLYQISQPYAKDALGTVGLPNVSYIYAHNQEIRDKMMDKLLLKAKADGMNTLYGQWDAALAYHNGGLSDYQRVLHGMPSKNHYSENILNNAGLYPGPGDLSPQLVNNHSSVSHNASINVQNLHLNNVQNPQQFTHALNDYVQSSYSFSSGRQL